MLVKFLKLAFKNISLYRRRSVLTGSVMTVSVIVIIFSAALGEAFYHQLVSVGIKTTTGHLQVFDPGWDFDIINPMSGDIPKLTQTARIESIIEQAPHLKAQGKEIIYQALTFDKTDRNFYSIIVGVEPEKADETLPGLVLMKGESIRKGIAEGAMISVLMDRYLHPDMNDMLYIIIGSPTGLMDGVKAVYKGVVRSMPLFAVRVAFTSLERMQKMLKWETDECTSIKVMLTDKKYAEETAAWLRQEFQKNGLDLEIKTWQHLGGFYYHIAMLGRVLVFIVLIILAAITAICVSNTMLMSVKERTKEIGTIMALGLRKNGVMQLFLLESFSLSLISSGLGVILGVLITSWFENRGLIEGLALVLEGKLYPMLGVVPVVISFFWILIIGTIGGLYPAGKASNLNPIEALRQV